ncbi:transmembrane protein 64 isoform X1 [Anabrus simplex]|uniref:transmembrane protein 64 isoform X1 n=1 Tax=Anabrus simplex TaxID=316456 RepID=UPI0035A36E16
MMDIITIEEGVTGFRAVKGDLPFLKFNLVSGIGLVYNIFLLLCTLIFVGILIFECKEYIKAVLLWVESQEQWIIYLLFACLFTLVSFPFTWGYTFLIVASGYLFGILRGMTIVLLTVNFGVVVAHFTIRAFHSKFDLSRYLENDNIRAILSVISGPRAFKVAAFARLTPIPFGLQNTIFAVSDINPRIYFIASFLGLIPAQVINIYLGSSLRSMEEVLSNKSTAATGVIVFFQITIGISLMLYVLVKARQELRKALNLRNYNELP